MAANLYAAAVNSVFTLTVKCVEDQKSITDVMGPTPSAGSPSGGAADIWDYLREVSDFFAAAAAGSHSINLGYVDAASTGLATGTITFTGNPADEDTVTIAGVAIAFETAAAAGVDEVTIGATQAATMVNLVNFINAGGNANDLAGIVTAVKTSATVITINSFYPGPIGNLITMSKSCANISAVTATLAGGAVTNYTGALSAGI